MSKGSSDDESAELRTRGLAIVPRLEPIWSSTGADPMGRERLAKAIAAMVQSALAYEAKQIPGEGAER